MKYKFRDIEPGSICKGPLISPSTGIGAEKTFIKTRLITMNGRNYNAVDVKSGGLLTVENEHLEFTVIKGSVRALIPITSSIADIADFLDISMENEITKVDKEL